MVAKEPSVPKLAAAVRRLALETADFDVFVGNDATAKLQGKFQLEGEAIARP
ncbi:hypothetical protein [Roseateles sp.]|uniref:hypothetical protein n=1 Tax=Roseateles sp. TaxID=1971397 RepID=UPI003938D8E8